MGEIAISYAKSTSEEAMLYHSTKLIEEDAVSIIKQARMIALETLLNEKKLLLFMAEKLTIQSRLDKDQIRQLLNQHMISEIQFDSEDFSYRIKLKEQLESLTNRSVVLRNIATKQNRA
jgi:hypothetical protein